MTCSTPVPMCGAIIAPGGVSTTHGDDPSIVKYTAPVRRMARSTSDSVSTGAAYPGWRGGGFLDAVRIVGGVFRAIVASCGRRIVQDRTTTARFAHRTDAGRTVRGCGAPRRGRRGRRLQGAAGAARAVRRDQGASPGCGGQPGVAPAFRARGPGAVAA